MIKKDREYLIKVIQNTIKTFDGDFDPTMEFGSKLMAKEIYEKLLRYRAIKGVK